MNTNKKLFITLSMILLTSFDDFQDGESEVQGDLRTYSSFPHVVLLAAILEKYLHIKFSSTIFS